MTDLSNLNSGAILIAIGIRLYGHLKKVHKETPKLKIAYQKLQELAKGKTNWMSVDDEHDYDSTDGEPALADRPSDNISMFDASRNISVGPANRFGDLRIGFDVPHQFLFQIGY